MSKKAFLILFFSIITYLNANAQKDTLTYYMKTHRISETETFSVPESDKDSADFVRTILLPDGNTDKSLFLIKDYYKNGTPKMIGTSTVRSDYIRLSGSCMEFFPDGKRKSVKNYKNGKLVDDVIQYFPNGQLYLTGKYDTSGRIIVNECRDSSGKVLVKNGNGHCTEYDPDFRRVYAEGNIANGIEEGEWHGFLYDSARYVCNYDKGIIKKGTAYDKHGKEYTFNTTKLINPVFNGGIYKFYSFLRQTIHYPAVAKKNNIQGKVYIYFIVNKDGRLSDFKIVSGLGSGCDEEVMRVMELSPPWIPASQFGMLLREPYTMPIGFTMVTEDK
ncbi:TonB family protein [Mucilaginibacter sp. McL0603]|uniref:TonB family protein n=1 Tax=Mucilaginibacter sp. McL0603 TaxID=3415670 RepID=UPI003CEF1FB0